MGQRREVDANQQIATTPNDAFLSVKVPTVFFYLNWILATTELKGWSNLAQYE